MGLLWLMGGKDLALSGTVRDANGAAIAGAIVSLVSDSSVRRMTDANGVFTIEKPVPIHGRRFPRGTGRNLVGLGIRGNRIELVLPAPAPEGSLSLFDIRGMKRTELPFGPLKAGTHEVELPALVSGVYTLRIAMGRNSGSTHLVQSGPVSHLMRRIMRDRPRLGRHGASASRRAAAVDALQVRKEGFLPARSPISSYDQAGIAIAMAPETG